MDSGRARCGFVQFRVKKGEVEENAATAARMVEEAAARRPDLLVLPELWACGFDYQRLADHCRRTPELLERLALLAAEHGTMIAGTLPEEDGGVIHNTMFLTGPDGVIGRHRKARLFSPMGEDRFFTPGPPPEAFEAAGARIAPLVCFELRFPELVRGLDPGIILVSAQWPEARIGQWELLIRARAVENQAFVVAANACGDSGDEPGGRSMIVAPDGQVVTAAANRDEAGVAELDFAFMAALRKRFSTAAFPRPRAAADKITGRAAIRARLSPWRGRGRIVFTNGCFDILHPGHAAYLEQARNLGDCLVVGLNSDDSVRRLKGEERPVNQEEDRARVLAALGCVDFVVIFGEDTPLELIREVEPDVLVKGGDWPVEKIVGGDFVKDRGGRVLSIPLLEGRSTTGIIAAIKKN